MRVLQVTAPARFGGLERVVHALAAGQVARGHEVHVVSVISPGDTDTPFHPPLLAAGVTLHVMELPTRAYLRERRSLRELCRRLQPHVVHTHGHRPDVIDSGVARRLGIPIVSTMHGFFHQSDWKGRLTDRLQLAAFRRFDAVVAVSRPLAEDLRNRGLPDRIIATLPNAYYEAAVPLPRAEARRALNLPPDALVAGCVGRLTHQKGLDIALDALARLGDPPILLSVVGDGEARSELQERARTLGIADRVSWHGARSDAPALMRAFDVFVMSSRWEGTPIALLEAMAAGVPVVVRAVGGVPEIVTPREGILVESEGPVALANALRRSLADPAAAVRRADAGRMRIRDEFGAQKWLNDYDALYDRVSARR